MSAPDPRRTRWRRRKAAPWPDEIDPRIIAEIKRQDEKWGSSSLRLGIVTLPDPLVTEAHVGGVYESYLAATEDDQTLTHGVPGLDQEMPPARIPKKRSSGAGRIATERERQVSAEGWTAEHDECHPRGELALAAAFYILSEKVRTKTEMHTVETTPIIVADLRWPFEGEAWKPTPRDRIRELTKAGALIAAEIDRLARAALSSPSAAPEEQEKP
jgi:hypothetical protein